jgi:hypothetical protein
MKPLNIWCLLKDQLAHVKPVEEFLGAEASFHYDGRWDPATLVSERPDLVLCVNDYHYDVVRCLDAARQAGIPSLTLQDGILEWRCQFENPLFAAGGGAPQHQPVMADKIACLGHQSARQIAAWGNAAKVEVTGMPRLDHLLRRAASAVSLPGHRILVMTAKNPGFTPAQREITLRSLHDVKMHLESRAGVTVLWRVSGSVAAVLQVENQMNEISSLELAAVIDRADAVITTPSTAMLEAMLLGRPVAALDYHNVPRFVPTAWTISAASHIEPVVTELLHPLATKKAFQHDCLADCLECDGPAAPRVATLIRKMIESPRPLPANLLNNGHEHRQGPVLQLGEWYADQPVFAETDAPALQVRLARAENENVRLKDTLSAQRLPARFARGVRRWAGIETRP